MALVSISKHITHQNGYSTNKRGICGICVCMYIYIYFKRSYIQHAMMTHLMPLILYASPKISTKTISQLGNSIWADVKSKRGVQYGGKRVVGWMRCSCQMSTLLVSSSLFFFPTVKLACSLALWIPRHCTHVLGRSCSKQVAPHGVFHIFPAGAPPASDTPWHS